MLHDQEAPSDEVILSAMGHLRNMFDELAINVENETMYLVQVLLSRGTDILQLS